MSDYLTEHGREGARVQAKVDSPKWVTQEVGPYLSRGVRVLEVGCGPMHLVRAARDTGAALAIGVDISRERLRAGTIAAAAGLGAAEAQAESLPFRDGAFDLVYSRFLLEYLPDPAIAVKQMQRVTRPGGTVLLQDLDGQLVNNYPTDEALESLLATFLLEVRGRLDVFVGRKLFALAKAAGLVDINVRVEPYHLIVGTPDGQTMDAWVHKLNSAYASMVSTLGEVKAAELRRRSLSFLADPGTLSYSVLFTVVARVPV